MAPIQLGCEKLYDSHRLEMLPKYNKTKWARLKVIVRYNFDTTSQHKASLLCSVLHCFYLKRKNVQFKMLTALLQDWTL